MTLCDPAAERGVLAGIFTGGVEAYADVADIVTAKTFRIDSNQLIWSCMDYLFKETDQTSVDIPSILSAAKGLGFATRLAKTEEMQHLRAVSNLPVLPANVRRMASRIRKLEIARLLTEQLDHAKRNLSEVSGDEPIDRILGLAEAPIFDLTSLLTGQANEGTEPIGSGAKEYVSHLMDHPREMVGISTGLPTYDFAIGGGIRPNSLDIIAARPKTGKTYLTDYTGLHIAGKLGVPTLNIDTEMSKREHQHRIIANLAGVTVRDIETGKCGTNQLSREKVVRAAEKLASIPYHYRCVIGMSFEDVLAMMRRWVTRVVGLTDDGLAKPCVIIYDYLKMLSSEDLSKNLQEYQMLGFITTALKNFMGRYGVGCLCFAQLNRDGIDREDTGVISGSDRIIHYCTSFTILKRKSDEERAEASNEHMRYTHKLVPVISRHGEGLQDGDYINVEADYRRGRITEGPTRNQLAAGVGTVSAASGFTIDKTEGTFDFAS